MEKGWRKNRLGRSPSGDKRHSPYFLGAVLHLFTIACIAMGRLRL